MSTSEELKKITDLAEQGGGQERIAKQHSQGKLTARERIALLLDPGSFVELDKFARNKGEDSFYGDGVVTGYGTVADRKVFLFAQDFSVYGGSHAPTHAKKIVKVMDLALKTGSPIIGLNDSGGARIQEGVESLAGYADIFLKNVLSSGVIPQISLILGPCAGGAVYSPAIPDFVLMVDRKSHMFITGPEVIKAVTKEEVTKEELGGAATHSSKSGVAHLVSSSEEETINQCKRLLSFIPSNNIDDPPFFNSGDLKTRTEDSLERVVPQDPSKPYDIRDIIRPVADSSDFFEVQEQFAKNIVIGFIRLDGAPIGVVANQPNFLAGCLDIDSSIKAARFVRFCDSFNIPLLTLVDVPGFLPGVNQEHGGIIRNGAKLLYAYAEATVPKVTLITRKAYGGAYDVMSSKHLRGDFNFAFPTAEIAVMGPEGAVKIVNRKELEECKNQKERDKLTKELTEEYREKFANPWIAAELGFIDEIILPKETRRHLIESFNTLKGKREENPKKKHGNIPL